MFLFQSFGVDAYCLRTEANEVLNPDMILQEGPRVLQVTESEEGDLWSADKHGFYFNLASPPGRIWWLVRTLEIMCDALTNAGKHVTSNVAKVCVAINMQVIQSSD